MTEDPLISARAPLWIGSAAAIVLTLGFGLWAAAVPIDGAILAVGEVDTASMRHVIEHPDGGIVSEVSAREGRSVAAGEILVRLSDPQLEMQWEMVNAQLAELRASVLRLTAERDGTGWSETADLATSWRAADGSAAEALENQRRLFEARRATFEHQLEQLAHRRRQAEAQLQGLSEQERALESEAALLAQDLEQQRQLQSRGLTQATRVTALEREAVRLAGRRAALHAQMAEVRGVMAEVDLQIVTLRAARREEAIAQLAEFSARMIELASRRAALEERLDNLRIRAPASGVVHGLVPLGPGMLLRGGEPLMQIVEPPRAPRLVFRIHPDDIDYVHTGQRATVQFPGLEATSVGLEAHVTAISGATFHDERTGASFFRVEMELTPESLAAVADLPVLPGLTAQAFLRTGARTPMAYFLGPILRQLNRALREP